MERHLFFEEDGQITWVWDNETPDRNGLKWLECPYRQMVTEADPDMDNYAACTQDCVCLQVATKTMEGAYKLDPSINEVSCHYEPEHPIKIGLLAVKAEDEQLSLPSA
jgi:hypothetical protein